ncbi:GntR family transcriptional regulator [Enterococcus cecorum]|uniref:GntR family transcriptional regulator n=1 Tax=Enterococcus cecorum TaxID=44008 RepID=UPI0032C46CF1
MSRSGYYHRVAEDLISRIEDGEFTPGDPLPKQIELAASYQTSRLTIQKAIQILITEGYVYVKKGNGTFVKTENKQSSIMQSNINECIGLTAKFKGIMDINNKVISFHVRQADDDECEKLELPEGSRVYDIIRLRYLNSQPFRLEYIIMPVNIVKNLDQSVVEKSLYDYISNSLSLKIGSALRKIKADRSDQYDHDFLDCHEADPVLEVEQVVSLKDGRPFEFSQLRYRYDKGQLVSNHVIE